ncbi:hypothetical protein JNW91_04965 [Micromonospora sp. STR1_7]|uniref:LPXTG cell wall anchor domain-containing protein n=1 Tax=Micromonospora parastrephiae TaxID=2806101 RepID=A0ABS1XPU8_9ACTN|nr:hypothetical protein [Micromonospora parastrephiae]MBM0231278.1 hypothetical protein [Micromonospora parastrephiae]
MPSTTTTVAEPTAGAAPVDDGTAAAAESHDGPAGGVLAAGTALAVLAVLAAGLLWRRRTAQR